MIDILHEEALRLQAARLKDGSATTEDGDSR